MKYGVGFYIFDAESRLLLIRKGYDKEWARERETKRLFWLVPGTTTGIPVNMRDLVGNEPKALELLAKDFPLDKDNISLCYHAGSWRYSAAKPRGEYNFENFVIKLRNLSPEELEEIKATALAQAGTDVTDIGFFHILNLPEAISPLTGGFLRSLLFHRLNGIEPAIGVKGQQEFDKLLGSESNKYFLWDKAIGGGYGDVYFVLDIASLSPRAIKIAKPNTTDPKWVDRFILEGTTLLSLLSEDLDVSVEKIFSINRIATRETQKQYYLVKNLVMGTRLDKMDRSKLDDKMIVDIMTRICQTLHKIHSCTNSIFHRDVKPNNIMIALEENVIKALTIIDFGLCKNKQVTIGTSSDFRTGNEIYQSVNTIKNYKNHNEIDDYYSAAQVLYWLIFDDDFYKKPRDQIEREKSKGVDKFLDVDWLEQKERVQYIEQKNLEVSFTLLRKMLLIISRYYVEAKPLRGRKKQELIDKTVEEIQALF